MKSALNIVPDGFKKTANAIRKAWGGDTCAHADWNPHRPEDGQCAVTALVVQDLFGGELLRTVANGESHYYNRIDGEIVDLTRAQFDEPLELEEPVERKRSYVLGFPFTKGRYLILLNRLFEQQLESTT